MKRQEALEAFGIILLALVIAVTVLTSFRTCEVLKDGQVVKVNCAEVIAYDK